MNDKRRPSPIFERMGELSTPLRVRLLRLLELEELGVGEIAKVVQSPQSTVSRHLKTLREGGWVVSRKEGTANLFSFTPELDEDSATLWVLVRQGTDGDYPEDGLRLASVLAAREPDSRAYFGRVAGRWGEVRRELFGEAWMSGMLALLDPDTTVLDLGCGPGDALAAVAPWVRQAVGVDREPAMLAVARERLSGVEGVSLRQGDLTAPPVAPGEADVALCMLVLHHVDAPGAVLAAVRPALSDRGRVVVVDMVAHDRLEYRTSMGHKHLGFDVEDVEGFAAAAGLVVKRHRIVPPAAEASGPPLFVAVLTAT